MPQPTSDLSTYIEARLMGERPHLRGRRLPVAQIAYAARDTDWNIPALMERYTLSEAEVLAALLFYAEHKAEIDDLEAALNTISIDEWLAHGEDALRLRQGDSRA